MKKIFILVWIILICIPCQLIKANEVNQAIEIKTNISSQNRNGKSNKHIVIDDMVYYIKSDNIYSMTIKGDNFKKISPEENVNDIYIYSIFVKGDELIFASDNLYAIKTDGKSIRKIVNLPTEVDDFYVYDDFIYYGIYNYINESYDIYRVSLNGENQKLLIKDVKTYCFDGNNNLVYIKLVDTKDKESYFDVNIFNTTTEKEKISTKFYVPEYLYMYDMYVYNNILFLNANSCFYGLKLNEDNLQSLKEIMNSGYVENFAVYNDDYYFMPYIGHDGPCNLFKYTQKDILNILNNNYVDSYLCLLENYIDSFQIFNNQLYIQKADLWFVSNINNSNKSIISDFNSNFMPLNLYPILYADNNYTYFLGGNLKNNGKEITYIDLESGKKQTHSSNSIKIEPWQNAYNEFLNNLYVYDNFILKDLNNDNIPELIVLSSDYTFSSDILTMDIYTYDGEVKHLTKFSYTDKPRIFYVDSNKIYISTLVNEGITNRKISRLEFKDNKFVETEFLVEQIKTNTTQEGINFYTYEYKKEGINITYEEFLTYIQRLDLLEFKNIWDYYYNPKWIYSKNESYINSDKSSKDLLFTENAFSGTVLEEGDFIYYISDNYKTLYSKHKDDNISLKVVDKGNIKGSSLNDFSVSNEGIIFRLYDMGFYYIDSNRTKIEKVLDFDDYYKLNIKDGWLYYCSNNNSNSTSNGLFKKNLKTKEVIKLINKPIEDYVFYEDEIYIVEQYNHKLNDTYELESFYSNLPNPNKLVTLSKINKNGSSYKSIGNTLIYRDHYSRYDNLIYVDETGIYFTNAPTYYSDGYLNAYKMNHDGKNITLLVSDDCHIIYFKKDGIYYINDSKEVLYKTNKDGSNKTIVLNRKDDTFADELWIVNDYIFFALEGYNRGLYRIKKDGSQMMYLDSYAFG